MAGNVWEWTGSWYKEGETRALRGGSWGDLDLYTRAAYRDYDYPHDGYDRYRVPGGRTSLRSWLLIAEF